MAFFFVSVIYLTKQNTQGKNTISATIAMPGEGNGNRLQCSCLENPRDGRAWWAAVYGVAQSRTRLNDLAAAAAMPNYL